MGNYSSTLTADVEDFKSIISALEKQHAVIEHQRLEDTHTLNHQTTDEKQTGQEMNEVRQEPDLLALKFLFTNTDTPNHITETMQNLTSAPEPVNATTSSSSGAEMAPHLPSLLSAALFASLASKSRPAPQGPLTMEQMKAQLGELRNELDLLKAQHKKEITLLMNELDEEKKMRLSLQIDVEHLKKLMSK